MQSPLRTEQKLREMTRKAEKPHQGEEGCGGSPSDMGWAEQSGGCGSCLAVTFPGQQKRLSWKPSPGRPCSNIHAAATRSSTDSSNTSKIPLQQTPEGNVECQALDPPCSKSAAGSSLLPWREDTERAVTGPSVQEPLGLGVRGQPPRQPEQPPSNGRCSCSVDPAWEFSRSGTQLCPSHQEMLTLQGHPAEGDKMQLSAQEPASRQQLAMRTGLCAYIRT